MVIWHMTNKNNQTIRLNNGVNMPMVGYGVYRIPAPITERCVSKALSTGYRLIDTAQCYGNEREVGRAVRASGEPRDEVFVTTKLWACRGYRDTLASIEESIRHLGVGPIDLLLMHEPMGDFHEVYRAMEDALAAGAVRAIGVSNFLEDTYGELISRCRVIPAIDQVEMHVFRQQGALRALLAEHGTLPQAWSPLAAGEHGIFGNPELARIAESHGKTTAQVALRFLMQQGISVIPKATHPEHMRENLDAMGFDLSEREMDELRALDEGHSLFNWW